MRTLHYNCPAGICGDMNLGAMIDLGVDPEALIAELKKLGLDGWSVAFLQDKRRGISGTRCNVGIEGNTHHHHHHDHHHSHEHTHEHSHEHGHSHEHRTFKSIRELIQSSSLDSDVKEDAIAVFRVLAEAEGKVHGMNPEDVHFHEVGALDSIVDIVGAAICWKLLGVDRVSASTIELGGGTVQCAHGRMPVPAPATARLVEGVPVSVGGTNNETTTPTGAALLVGKHCAFNTKVSGRTVATGIGVGQRDDPNLPNVLYVSLMDAADEAVESGEEIVELATNLDDMSPERVAYLAETLMEAGALDVWQTPATFKKGRLGCVLNVLAPVGLRQQLTQLIFRHSSTLGVRWKNWNRSTLEREIREEDTPLGKVRVKDVMQGGKPVRSKIEYDDLRRLAREHDLSVEEVEEKLRSKS